MTESILVQDVGGVLATVRRIKALGVQISIDDFGTGYFNLAYLQRFDVDRLKIDQKSIRQIVTNKDETTIVCAIIDLAGALRLTTIAEGIEYQEAAQCLRAMGCLQGRATILHKPMTVSAVAAFVTGHCNSSI